ncbi:hypothetical protein HYALB_00010018 [Hymenoscyphus albidus]|uniref:Uncharacterized protein n=1 Tax=Hymenoscyphus albidus TaxID=595503 RepID=A0A9N9LPN3_9HELO|nr:hypothetical protein HYALB_00010018 [Hymenoscyphus albidus]
MSTTWNPTYPWENQSQDVTSNGAARFNLQRGDSDAITLVDEHEKNNNPGERKSSVNAEVREGSPQDGVDTRPTRNQHNGWGLDDEKENLSKEERKARFEEAERELKRIVPVPTKYPRVMALIPMMGLAVASMLFVVSGSLYIKTSQLSRQKHEDAAKSIQATSYALCWGALMVTLLTQITFQFVLLKPLQKRILKLYEERYLLDPAQLAALGCGDLEGREQRRDDGEGVDGWVRAAVVKRAFGIVLPWPRVQLAIWVLAPVLAVVMFLAS